MWHARLEGDSFAEANGAASPDGDDTISLKLLGERESFSGDGEGVCIVASSKIPTALEPRRDFNISASLVWNFVQRIRHLETPSFSASEGRVDTLPRPKITRLGVLV
jgi:hypothetical protein